MTIQQILQAINECERGFLNFNLGYHRSFLFNKCWYPLRAIVNRARELNGESPLTSDRALYELSTLFHYIRVNKVKYTNNLPIEIDNQQTMEEIRTIVKLLNSLSN